MMRRSLATWRNPNSFAAKPPNPSGQLFFRLPEKRAQRVVCIPTAPPALESYFRLFPVVPFGHRPANCLQASGFHYWRKQANRAGGSRPKQRAILDEAFFQRLDRRYKLSATAKSLTYKIARQLRAVSAPGGMVMRQVALPPSIPT